eukprot:scaffold3153_cov149-Skeletonema_marinoi.AAC.19
MGKKWTPGPSPPAPSAALTIPSGHLVRTTRESLELYPPRGIVDSQTGYNRWSSPRSEPQKEPIAAIWQY